MNLAIDDTVRFLRRNLQHNIGSLPEPSKAQVVEVYKRVLGALWLVFVGVSCLGSFVVTFVEKHIELWRYSKEEFNPK